MGTGNAGSRSTSFVCTDLRKRVYEKTWQYSDEPIFGYFHASVGADKSYHRKKDDI
jgi:hypothetical protein